MYRAQASRCGHSGKVGYFKKIANFGNIAGSLLLRAFDRSVKVGNAMASRGYTGKYTLFTYEKKKLPKWDILAGSLIVIASISVVLVDAFILPYSQIGHTLILAQHSFSIYCKFGRKKVLKAIETINLCYTYHDGTKALNNLNFSVEKGENMAILGPNGAGKSTLLHHFNGLLTPSSGKVLVLGQEVVTSNIDWVRQKVGLVFQDPDDQLFARTVGQDVAFGPLNLGLPPEEIKARVKWALEATEITDLEHKSPQNLSTGQKKRAALAGVLAMKPEIIVLDEPMANLDPRTASKVLKLLLQLNKELGLTLIIATHDVDLVPLFANEICILSKGQIVTQGSPEEVFTKTDLLRSLDLRIPRITHLFEILSKRNQLLTDKHFPLTIGEARKEIVELLEANNKN